MLCVYTGTDSRYYGDYLNRLTGRMLEAEPGLDLYDIDVAPGRNPTLPVPPGDGRWAPATAEQVADFTDGTQDLPNRPRKCPPKALRARQRLPRRSLHPKTRTRPRASLRPPPMSLRTPKKEVSDPCLVSTAAQR